MNKTYRLIWNDARQSWTVTHEAASSRGKPASKAKPLAALLAGALLMHGGLAQAIDPATLPTGGQVVSGQASISQSGSAMTINQGSNQAILNWNSFSIGSGASVEFLQPSSSSVALNRVIGTDPSAIYGSLTANGQVFLINPNGVLFGEGARVDVGGLVASTLNIRDEDFLNGSYRFSRDGATGSVVNQGELYGKYVALLAPEVRNEGVIVAQQGTAALAAGEAVTLNITGNRLIGVQVDQASIDTLVENKHLIQADDGMVVMSAQSANGLIGRVVNTGAVEARGIVNDGGVIRLLASSNIEHSGSINADAGTHGKGGNVILMGDLANPDSRTVVSGSISARGGSESGDGGFIETSGTHLKITDAARIDTAATHGQTGQWLLDPYDFTIGTDITGAALGTALNSNSVTIETTASNATCTNATCGAGSPAGNGDIFVHDSVTWSNSSSTLTLKAYRNIVVDGAFGGSITTPFLGTVYLLFGQGTSGTYTIQNGAMIADPSGGLGSEPTVYAPDGSTFGGVQLDSTSFTYTSAATAFVRLDSGLSSTYGGSRTINWTASVNPDGTGGTLGTGTDTTGSTAWESAPFTYLTSTTSAGTANYTYSSGISSSAYYWLAGNAVAWTVNKADLTLSGSRPEDGTTNAPGSTLTATGVNSETFTVSGAGDASNLSSSAASATPQLLASVTGLSLGTGSNGGVGTNYNALSTTGSSYTLTAATGGTTPPPPAGTTTSDGGKLLEIITKSLLKQSNEGESFNKTIADFLLAKKGQGIETQGKNDALEFIRLAVKAQCGEQCSVSEEAILEWLGGIQTPKATLKASITDEAVKVKGNPPAKLDKAGLRDMINRFAETHRQGFSFYTVAFAKVQHNVMLTLDDAKRADVDNGLPSNATSIAGSDFAPDLSGSSFSESLSPSAQYLTDQDLNYYFKTAQRFKDVPLSTVVAYLNTTSSNGGKREFRLEGGNIVSGPPRTDEEVSEKDNRQPQMDERDFLSMNAHLFRTFEHMGNSSSVATAKVREAVGVALNKARDPDSGLDFHPDAVAYADKIAPDLSDLSDNELELFFYGANQREVAGDWPKSAVVAYLNRTANKGGARTFRLEDGRIVSTPEKAPHYHVTAETNLQPGTAVTVSIKDANGTTKSTKAVVGEKGEVKVDGAVGEMKQPLQIDISSEQPEYQSKPITVFTMRSKAEAAFEKLNAGQRGELIQLLYENRWNAENTENPEAEALKKLLGTLSGKDDPAYDGAKTALKEALESPNADEKALFEVLTNLPRRPENPLREKFSKLDVAQQMWIKSALRFPAGTTETAADALKALLSASNEKGDPAYDGAKAALKEVLESPNADEKALFEILKDLGDTL